MTSKEDKLNCGHIGTDWSGLGKCITCARDEVSKDDSAMLTIDKEIDKILLAQLYKMSEDIDAFGITDCKNYLPEYRQAIKALLMKETLKAVREDRLASAHFYKKQVDDLFNDEIRVYEQALSTSKESEEV